MATPELRIDPLTGLKVVLAPARADRPLDFETRGGGRDDAAADCPLDEGREQQTPPELWAMRRDGGPDDSPGWLVRAVPNKFPVLAAGHDDDLRDPLESGRGDPDLFASTPATGAHEVIVHTPEHLLSLAELGSEQLRRATEGWRERLLAHRDSAYVHVMVNEGAAGGASLEHSHAQLYALDFVPALVARERERFTAHSARTMGGCLLCDLVQQEVKLRDRVVAFDDDSVLMAPFASRTPYELRIVPREHEMCFSSNGDLVAPMLGRAVGLLRERFGASPPMNIWVRTAPKDAEHFHWYVDVMPRLTGLAGFELGTGVNINIVAPERVAEELRGLVPAPERS